MAAAAVAIPIPLQQSYNEVNYFPRQATDFSGFHISCNSLHSEVIFKYNNCVYNNTCKVSFNLHAKAG